MVRVAINGFGRIGRQILQAGIEHEDIEWVAVNDLTDTHTLAHLLKYDSVFGRFPGTVESTEDTLTVNGKTIKVFAEKDPEQLPWKELNIDVVVESTGFFRTKELASKHVKAGAGKVLISAPSKNPDFTVVKGVNEHDCEPGKHVVVSNASCTTNALAPMIKVVHDNFKVKRGHMITVHGYTSTQKLVDGPHKDLRRARAAAVSIIPTTTGAAVAVTKVIPDLKGKLEGFAIRVPVPDGSFVTFTGEVEKETSVEEINKLFKNVSEHHLKGIVEYTEEPIVSIDIIKNPHSCIFDALSTKVIDKTFVSVSCWYDNEWGYSNRIVDVLKLI